MLKHLSRQSSLAFILQFAGLAFLSHGAQAGTATTTALSVDFSPSAYGQAITFKATVSPAIAGAPTGTVTFSADSSVLNSASVNAAGIVGSVAAGTSHTCAVTNSGGARCWGLNAVGQLGDGTMTRRTSPQDVSGLTSGVLKVTTGSDFSCALTTGGGVKCWGHNNLGQLGDSTGVDSSIPVDVSGLSTDMVAVSAGGRHACAVTTLGAVKCWGGNDVGQLGDNSGLDQLAPVDVVGLGSGIVAISAGAGHSCALTSDGAAQCWGGNAKGAVGDGTIINRPTPVAVSGLGFGVSAIAAGVDFTCAVTTDGVKCWGDNSTKQLGDGTTTQRNSPGAVLGLAGTPQAIVAGGAHACMLNSAGVIKCWGQGSKGQLGNGVIVATSAPVSPTGYSSAGGFAIAAGGQHSCAVKSNGSLDCWGLNSSGQLGDGSLTLGDAPNGVTDFGPATMSIAYKAVLSVSSLAVGVHSIDAHYDGDATFDPSDATPLSQTINIGATTTAVTPSSGTPTVGQNVTFHIAVARVAPAVGTPTGTATIDYGDGTGTAVPLSGGTADPVHSYAGDGTYNITVTYGGDGGFDASSGGTSVIVSRVVSTLTVAPSPNPATPGQKITFTATLNVPSGAPSGNVTFREGGTTLGVAPVSAMIAKLATSSLGIGSHTVQAVYSGDTTFFGSSNSAVATVDARVGSESRVNTNTTGSQQLPAIIRRNTGYLVAWSSNLQDGSGFGVYAQRYTDSGVKLGSEFQVNTATAKDQTQPALARLSDGGSVICWQSTGQDGSGLGIFCQRYSSAGAKTGSEFRANKTTASNQSVPAIAGLAAGGFVIVWQSSLQDTSGSGVYAQRYDGLGNRAGGEFRVNRQITNDQSAPAIAALTGGGFVVTWQSSGQDGSGLGVYAKAYNSVGGPVSGELRVNRFTTGDQSLPSVASLSDGGFIIAWQSAAQDGSGLGIYAQRYSATAVKSGTEFRVNSRTAGNQSQPVVAGFDDGGFVIAWVSSGQDGSGLGVYAQTYKASGATANVEFRVNTFTTGDQWQPAVAGAAKGTFMAVWTSLTQDGSLEGIFGQRFRVPTTP